MAATGDTVESMAGQTSSVTAPGASPRTLVLAAVAVAVLAVATVLWVVLRGPATYSLSEQSLEQNGVQWGQQHNLASPEMDCPSGLSGSEGASVECTLITGGPARNPATGVIQAVVANDGTIEWTP